MGRLGPAVFGIRHRIRTRNHQGFSPDLAIHSNCPWHFWFSFGDYLFSFGKISKISKQKTVSVLGTNSVLLYKEVIMVVVCILPLANFCLIPRNIQLSHTNSLIRSQLSTAVGRWGSRLYNSTMHATVFQ